MNLREWLVVLGGVVIVGIVIDGIRRMHRARKDSMEISMGMGGEIENTPLDEGFNPELPNGGARPVGSDILDPKFDGGTVSVASPAPAVSERDRVVIRQEPSFNEGALDGDDSLSAVRVVSRKTDDVISASSTNDTSTHVNDAITIDKSEIRAAKTEPAEEETPKKKMTFGEGLKASSKAKIAKVKSSRKESKSSKSNSNPKPAQEVIVLNVMSRTAEGFNGAELDTLLNACGVEHGEMSIYHRHESTVDSPVQFSVANAVEPGYFPKDQIASMSTPGISFFMSLPGPDDNMRAFDYMVETAQCVVRNLSGEMKDERRSDMTPQTLEHCRERIRDFERRQLTARC